MMSPGGDDDLGAFFLARRFAKPWKGRERTRPKMPSTMWRLWAVITTTVGALAGWLIFGDSDAVVLRTVAGGVVGLVVGMFVVETIWERRLVARQNAGPIGKRR